MANFNLQTGGRKGIVALLLAALMTFTTIAGTLTGCSAKESAVTSPSSVSTDDMERDDIDAEIEDISIHTAYNKAGAYSVSFGESDMIFAKDSKKATDEVLNAIDPDMTFDKVTQDDIKVQYSFVTYPEVEEGAEETGVTPEPIRDKREATIDSFSNNGRSIKISFTDADAAENQTGSYVLYIEKMGAVAIVSTDFADHTLTSDVTSVANTINDAEFKITAAEGNFAKSISPENITLEGSFKEMSVDSVSASGNKLTVKLSGSPVLEEDICTTYTAGIITVNEEGFENGTTEHRVFINVAPPSAFIDQSGLEFSDGKLTVPMQISGIDAASIEKGDVQFEKGVTVTGVEADGDDRILVTVKVNGANDLASAVDAIASQQTTVGEAEMFGNVAHASFYTFFDYIEQDGDNLKFTLKLKVNGGTVSDGISAEMVTLGDDFADGTIESIKKNSDTEAELVVSVAANGMTSEDFELTGTVTLCEGALIDAWGEAAPECIYSRYLTPEEIGRISINISPDTIIGYTIEGLGYIDKDAQKVAEYGKSIYEIYKKASSLDVEGTVSAVKGLLVMAGILDPDPVQKSDTEIIKEEMQKMNDLLNAMNGRLDKVLKAQYDTYLQGFDKSVNDMATYAAGIQEIFGTAMADLNALGLTAPADNASAEELAKFEKDFVDAIIAQDRAGNRKYKGFEFKMGELEKNYVTATNMVISGKGDSSPFYYYDQIWTMYFNYETQPYYLRKAYRTNVEFQIKNAYNLLAVYYNLSANPSGQAALTKNLTDAVDEIARHSAGTSPEKTDQWGLHNFFSGRYGGMPVYCYTMKRSVIGFDVVAYKSQNVEVLSDDVLNEYIKRLHGNTITKDLNLAGYYEDLLTGENWNRGYIALVDQTIFGRLDGLVWRSVYGSSGGSWSWSAFEYGAWSYAIVVYDSGNFSGRQIYDQYGTDHGLYAFFDLL